MNVSGGGVIKYFYRFLVIWRLVKVSVCKLLIINLKFVIVLACAILIVSFKVKIIVKCDLLLFVRGFIIIMVIINVNVFISVSG